MGEACSMYGEEWRWIQDIGGETWGKEATWEDPGVDGMIILKHFQEMALDWIDQV